MEGIIMEWIKVEEREPPKNQSVIVFNGIEVREGLLWDDNKWRTDDMQWLGKVTHWIPLPAPPERGE